MGFGILSRLRCDSRVRCSSMHTSRQEAGRLICIADILSRIPYKRVRRPKVTLPKRSKKHAYDDIASKDRRLIKEMN
jgi:polyphosphate kinase